jgi:hypothetical protein
MPLARQLAGALLTLLAKTVSNVTASAQSGIIFVGAFKELSIFLDAANVSGTTPTLDVKIETSPDGTNWYQIGTFTQVTTVASKQVLTLGSGFTTQGFGNQIRANYTAGGTSPNYTVGITAIGK